MCAQLLFTATVLKKTKNEQNRPPVAAMSTEEERPVVLLHRTPAFKLPFTSPNARFTLLDPLLHSADSTHSFLSRHASSVRAILCLGPSPLTSDTLSLLPALEIVVASSSGIDHIDLQECRRRGILVTNAGNAFSEDVADYAVGLLIDVLRSVPSSDRFVRMGLWPKHGAYPLGSTVWLSFWFNFCLTVFILMGFDHLIINMINLVAISNYSFKYGFHQN